MIQSCKINSTFSFSHTYLAIPDIIVRVALGVSMLASSFSAFSKDKTPGGELPRSGWRKWPTGTSRHLSLAMALSILSDLITLSIVWRAGLLGDIVLYRRGEESSKQCDMIKRNELDVGGAVFEILAETVFKFLCFILFLALTNPS